MRLFQLEIKNFRCIRHILLMPERHNVFLAPNNSGKTAILEALNLLLNPDLSAWTRVIDENDFFNREYLPSNEEEAPVILIEAVIGQMNEDDEELFAHDVIGWDPAKKCVVDEAEEGEDLFASSEPAIRVAFEGFYDFEDDDFKWKTFFRRTKEDGRDDAPSFGKNHKRRIGFLIYRDIRALSRPTTLEPTTLFSRLLQSQDVCTRNFEEVLNSIDSCLEPIFQEPDFISVLNSYKAELERFLVLDQFGSSALSFELTARTRDELKTVAQLYTKPLEGVQLPIQKMGAGTRSLALLAILTLIMRHRNRGILALEEPETFLFPHAQRRVLNEALKLADQVFVTTHSPYVLEQMPLMSIGKLERKKSGDLEYVQLTNVSSKAEKLYNKRLRQTFSEAMLGRAVVVVEGDSDKWWVDAAAELMDGVNDGIFTHESFDLAGVTVVSSESHGDSLKTADFFEILNLPVVILLDRIDDPQAIQSHLQSKSPTIFLKQTGIERAIVENLELGLVTSFLVGAPLVSGVNSNPAELVGKNDSEQRELMFSLLKKNKGSRPTHEWILERLKLSTFPVPLLEAVRIINRHLFGEQRIGNGVSIIL